MLIKIVRFLRGNRGASVPFVAIVLTLLLILAGVVIDLGHLYVVRQELKNAADAGALAGALALFNIDVSPHVLCAEARAAALATVQLNESDHQNLNILSEDVKIGFWEYVGGVWQFREESASCPDEINAVQVTTRRTNEVNGPVSLFFAKFLGMDTVELTAKATAMRGWATSLPEGFAFPLAIGLTYVPKTYGQIIPVTFSPDWGDTGGWHCFDSEANANDLVNYINESKPTPSIDLNDWIYVLNGVATSVVMATENMLKQYSSAGKEFKVYLPVIDATKMTQTREVLGFCAFIIKSVDKSTKAVSGDALGFSLVPGETTSPIPPENNNLRDIHAKLVQ
ncbi:MAG: TadG family pilus assembly protein [Deltaproteobacteria bacterium]|nr:TadG family pilus assembly protein [Desulfitobacteriaceae bacterium]MDI6854824.1 TadG family pilus assembly protein [Deltaproteobacteria bacterium]